MFTWQNVNKRPHSIWHEIAVFLFSFLFWYIVFLPTWDWRECRKGFPHSAMMLTESISVSVWANLLMLWWNITGVSGVFNPIGPANIISRCLIMLNVGSALRAFFGGSVLKTICSKISGPSQNKQQTRVQYLVINHCFSLSRDQQQQWASDKSQVRCLLLSYQISRNPLNMQSFVKTTHQFPHDSAGAQETRRPKCFISNYARSQRCTRIMRPIVVNCHLKRLHAIQ